MASTTPVRPWTDRLKDRWTTGLAVGLSALTFGGSASEEGVVSLAEVLLLLPLLYLVVAKVERRQASWPGLVVGITALLALRALDVIASAAVFSAVALLVLVWGAVDGQLRRPDPFRVRRWGCSASGRWPWPGWSWTRAWGVPGRGRLVRPQHLGLRPPTG